MNINSENMGYFLPELDEELAYKIRNIICLIRICLFVTFHHEIRKIFHGEYSVAAGLLTCFYSNFQKLLKCYGPGSVQWQVI